MTDSTREPRTPAEILARIEAVSGNDWMGTIRSDLLAFLPFDVAKVHLGPAADPAEWAAYVAEQKPPLVQAEEYMAFAWDKANNCRGLSAARSLDHMAAWLWLAREDDFLAALRLDAYSHYGKPQLRAICERFGWDWRALDDGRWVNQEHGPSSDPDSVALSI